VRAGALERDGPRRGGVEPSSEVDLARGGGFSPRARRNSPEGASDPQARRSLLEGRSAVPPWRIAGATRVVVVSYMCFRCVS
jgi:hypothetical protein